MRYSMCTVRALVCLVLLGSARPALPQKILINLGTVAPEGSIWHEILLDVRQQWEQISGGKVILRIYPSGVQGDEGEMLRKVRIGQLQAVALSGAGLSRIDSSVSCLQVPMLIETYEELDYVVERVTPTLEKKLAEKGFVVLHWGDVGWVHFFTKKPARTLDDIREMKLFTSAGDPETEKLYKEFGFKPIPLAVTDLLPSLQTGMIDAIDVPPLFALLQQTFALASHMIPVKWAPLTAATVMSERSWQGIPAVWREEMILAARAAAEKRRDEIRRMGEDAVEEMRRRGLEVVELDEAALVSWHREAEQAYPRLRGTMVPEELFDQVTRLSREFKQRQGTTGGVNGTESDPGAARP